MATYFASMTKQVGAELDYEVDWTAWLETGDTLMASSWAVPAGITPVSNAHTTTTATILVSGGTVGVAYDLVNTITTTHGLTDLRTIRLRIVAD